MSGRLELPEGWKRAVTNRLEHATGLNSLARKWIKLSREYPKDVKWKEHCLAQAGRLKSDARWWYERAKEFERNNKQEVQQDDN